MAIWHRSWKADGGLRLLGLALCAIAYAAIARLVAHRPPGVPQPADAAAYGLAAIGFLSASTGGALLHLGGHLFDEIEVLPRRWHGLDGPQERRREPRTTGSRVAADGRRDIGDRQHLDTRQFTASVASSSSSMP